MKNNLFKLGVLVLAVLFMGCMESPDNEEEVIIVGTTVETVSVSPQNQDVSKGGQQQFTATVSGANSPPQTVTWSVNGNEKEGTAINASGLLSVAIDETAETLTVTATSTYDTGKSGVSTVNLLTPTVETVSVTPQNPSISRGSSSQFSASVSGTNSPPQNVIWAVSGNAKDGTTINAGGLLSVAIDETAETLTVTATSTYDTGKSGVSTVNLLTPTVDTVSVTPQNPSISRGSSRQFSASVSGTNSPPQNVIWAVSGNAKDGTTISAIGNLSVASDETSATLTVTATSTYDTGKSGSSTVTVQIPTVNTVSVSPSTVSLVKGASRQFTATVSGTNSPPTTVTWSVSGNEKIGTTISAIGNLSVASDETSATLTVTATSTYDTGKSGSSTVTVTVPDLDFYRNNILQDLSGTSGTTYLDKALNFIKENAYNNVTFSIVLNRNISYPYITLDAAAISNRSGIKIIITGKDSEKTITFTTTGIWLEASVELIIGENVTLRSSTTSGSVVTLRQTNSTTVSPVFRMIDGSKITGNTNYSTSSGVAVNGAVNVSAGTFYMEGGIISDNNGIASSLGTPVAGVYVGSGTFNMSGGIIENNHATANNDNNSTAIGGVFISNLGYFNISGGIIRGNTALAPRNSVGGVYVNNNYANRFTISGDSFIIYGGNAGEGLANKATTDGGSGIKADALRLMTPSTTINDDIFGALPTSGITYSAVANNATYTTAINLTFASAVSGLTAGDINITSGTGSVTKGGVTGSGTSWSIGVTVVIEGTVNISITKAGIESGSKPVTVGVDTPEGFSDLQALANCLVTLGSNTAATPYPLEVNINLETNWNDLLATLITAQRYVSLNLSGSTGTTMSRGSYTEQPYIVSVILPNSVTSIGERSFYSCTSLTSVTIPNSVTSIGEYAFYSCTSLAGVTIPDGVTSIGNSTFFDCTSLASVTIGNGVTSIGNTAFYSCTSLTSVTIPDSVTSIGSGAFRSCSNLASVTIGNGVTSIGAGAFQGCSSLTGITIPDSVTSIGERSFYSCTSLTSVTIPNSVTSIGNTAFYFCSNLASITIPDSVTSIEAGAFSGCSSLASVTFNGSIASGNFSSTYSFPGDLRTKYFAAGGGIGTYTTANPGDDSAIWTKQL